MYFCVVLCIVCFVTFPVLFVCICVLNNCHRVATQLQLNIYHIISNWCQGPVPGRGPAVEKHCSRTPKTEKKKKQVPKVANITYCPTALIFSRMDLSNYCYYIISYCFCEELVACVHFVPVILVGHNLKFSKRSYVVTLDLQTIFSTQCVDKQLPSGLHSSAMLQKKKKRRPNLHGGGSLKSCTLFSSFLFPIYDYLHTKFNMCNVWMSRLSITPISWSDKSGWSLGSWTGYPVSFVVFFSTR